MTVLLIVIAVVVVIALYVIVTYNGLIKLKNRVEADWAQIDVQLKRRGDLIPNLVETVRAYASHERATLEAVVNARNAGAGASTPAQAAAADNLLTGALRQLFAVSEAYPDLKANQNFLELQEELSSTEGRIAYARQAYNDTVARYNTKIETFPSVIVANALKFGPREYFEADEASREVPKVQF
jgi:LemA protein